MNKNCVDFCSNRFSNASFFLNDGLSLPMIEDNSTNFVFSWDSFVHMHKNIVEKYLSEILRILVLGGHACIHHANFLGGTDFFTKNRHGRANLTPEEFSKLCKKYSLEIIQQKPITFEETDRLHPPSVSTVTDIISIVKKVKELDKKSLKIGLQILAYNCKEAFPRLIEPWAKLKEELNFKFWVHSRQFRIYEEMGSEDVNAETLEMLKTDYSELIDCLSVPEETLSDHESRSLCLEFFEKEDVDLIWMLDADEFYTEQQIRNIIDFIKNNSQFDWFSIQLKNYVVDESTWEDFAPLRVIRAKRHGGIREYYWDNHFSYKDDTEYRAHPNKTIPKDIAFPDHYTWTNTMNTTGPKHIKEKIEYQKKYYTGGCGYKWNEEKQSIEVNKDNR
jgi:hypothetical protein